MLEAPPLPYDVHFLKRSDQLDYGIPVFSIMRNESYFFPHFLKHYRSLGISNFVIFADRCDDEFLETMLREHDVSIIRSNSLKYHQTFGQLESGWPKRLVQFIKEFISNQFFVGRWHLVVDADEFLILPAPMRDFPAYVQWLEGSGMDAAFASMIDFYPQTLAGRNFAIEKDPFQASPYFDRGPYHRLDSTRGIITENFGVRGRMLKYLKAKCPEKMAEIEIEKYEGVINFKFPLMKATDIIQRIGCHMISRNTRFHRCTLAHFKFYPGLDEKIKFALSETNYFRLSSEYKFLNLAISEIEHNDLVFEKSGIYRDSTASFD
jgi:hypothetical protein